ASKRFGGGKVIRPMELTIGDRATFCAAGKKIPVKEISVEAAKTWFRKSLRLVDPERHVRYRVALAPGSEELTDIFSRKGRVRAANDTSAGVGYYPLSHTEKAVLAVEQHLNSAEFKRRHPGTGEDVKVMGLRSGSKLTMTVAMPILTGFVRSEEDYFAQKEALCDDLDRFVDGLGGFMEREVFLNSLDERGRGLGGMYLSLLGTSAEDADSGQVGRGNRVNGLISMNRPMSTEAAAGKNPVSHVGKIYNVLAHRIAKEIYESGEGIKEVHVMLLSRIGVPIDQPQMATSRILIERGTDSRDIKERARAVIEKRLSTIGRFCLELARGKYPVC
ncbi:MAG TPA: methionine adenosyltransferase, partial [Dissulfurispiraceae bacterium]|nr:methionine adenosyltransferase [Dissulfurispiraceae bacterium]